jgi:hypothetical protein
MILSAVIFVHTTVKPQPDEFSLAFLNIRLN